MGTHPIFESDFDCLTEGMSSTVEFAVAYCCIGIAVLIFGTNFIPVKKVATGDGIFFQLIVTIYIWTIGLITCFVRNSFNFEILPMLGGFLWATGNLCKVPIIKTIGIGMGQIIWATTNCLVGWAIARFGLFGGVSQVPSNVWLNYVGVGLTISSLLLFIFVDSRGKTNRTGNSLTASTILNRNKRASSIGSHHESLLRVHSNNNDLYDPDWLDRLSAKHQKMLGLSLSLLSGSLYGANFMPITLAVEQQKIPSHLDGTFSHFTGILASHLFYFLIYSVYRQNSPHLYQKAVLPGALTGLTWGIAFICWLYSNSVLGEATTFPILATAPSVLGCVVGIYFFREVSERKHIILACVGSVVCIAGILCTAFSK